MAGPKIKEKERARLLRRKGYSLGKIARKIGVAKSSVSLWVRDVPLTYTQQKAIKHSEHLGSEKGRKIIRKRWIEYRKANPHPKSQVNFNRLRIAQFFGKWTPKSAYVMGFFAADGCMYHSENGGYSTGGCYVEFGSTDHQLIETVRDLIQAENKIEIHFRQHEKRKTKYLLRIVNKQAYNDLLHLGFTPAKTLTLQFPDVPNNLLGDFVRGYFSQKLKSKTIARYFD